MTCDRILSGVRPTGYAHLGNYLGAIVNWVEISKQAKETFFCIVDQHALTTLTDREDLKQNTLIMAATYIACGIDPLKNAIFVQSHVPYHTELSWYLTCLTPMGWLSRMTQFKDKAGKHKDQALTGLFTYPVLMAADILLYKASHVPVGDDQKQHVEFARDIAQVFNNLNDHPVLKMPEPFIQKVGARIKSLRDGTKKMSKSDVSDYSRIHLNDSDDLIAQKIKKAKTDPLPITADKDALKDRPELENLLTILSIFEKKNSDLLLQEFDGKQFSDLKSKLIDATIAHITPIRQKIEDLLKDEDTLKEHLKNGSEKANEVAHQTIVDVRKSLKLYQS
ncbi:MAG: Tryptophan--tRNA ligase [Holosporales bacterium]